MELKAPIIEEPTTEILGELVANAAGFVFIQLSESGAIGSADATVLGALEQDTSYPTASTSTIGALKTCIFTV